MARIILFLVLILLFIKSEAQNVSSIKLVHGYSGTLDLIINQIGNEHHLKFIFDKEKLSKFKTTFHPSYNEVITVGKVFQTITKSWDLIIEIGNDGNIYIGESDQAIAKLKNTVIDQRKTLKSEKSNFNLTGIVKDAGSGERIPFASIYIKNTKIGTTSNADGLFTLQKVPSDTSTLFVSYIGFNSSEIYLTPETNISNLVIELSASTTELKEVQITGQKENLMSKPEGTISTIIMSPKNLSVLPNIGEKDVLRSFQLMPGVSASNENSSGMYVRGGTPDQNLILYDGFTVYHVDHLYGFFSAFNSNAVKDVQLFKGGFESKYGGRLSSVTEITGKDGNAKKVSFGGDISLLSIGAYFELPIGEKFTSMFAVRRSYRGPIYNKIFDRNQTQKSGQMSRGPGMMTTSTKAKSYFYDLNGKLTFLPSSKDIISLSFFNGTDDLDNSPKIEGSFGGMAPPGGSTDMNFNMKTVDLTKYGNLGSSLKWSRKWGAKLYSNTLLSYSNYYSGRDRTTEGSITTSDGTEKTMKNGLIEDNDLKDVSFKTNFQYDISGKQKLEFGYFLTNYNIAYTYTQNDTSSIIDRKDDAFLTGAYLQDKLEFLAKRLAITPGLRLSSFTNTNKLYLEPRLSAFYKLNDKLTASAATGLYYQFANRVVREDIMSGSKDFWILSDDKTVPVSSAIHYITGVNYDMGNYLFSVEGYFKQIQNITEFSTRFKPGLGGIKYQENYYVGNGYSKGIELLAQKKTGNLNGWISYTLGKANSKFEIYSDNYYPSSQDVTHEFKTVLIYKLGRFDFSATWIYATGRPYTAPEGAYTVTLLDGTKQEYYTVSDKNSLRLPAYHRLDLAASFRLISDRNKDLGNISVSLFNVYNRNNVWYKEFQIVNNSIVETNVSYMGITPNISLSLKF